MMKRHASQPSTSHRILSLSLLTENLKSAFPLCCLGMTLSLPNANAKNQYDQSNQQVTISQNLTAKDDPGITVTGGNNNITINPDVIIQGYVGIYTGSRNTFNNNGHIQGAGFFPGPNGVGLFITEGTINNNASGVISSLADGIESYDRTAVNNSGQIRGSNAIMYNQGGNYTGLKTGELHGTITGITMADGTSNLITNAGLIEGTQNTLQLNGKSTGSIVNDTTGKLTSSSDAAVLTTDSASYNLTNRGNISGGNGVAINFSGYGNNTLTLDTGSTLKGDVISSTADTNTLLLSGSGAETANFVGSAADKGFKALTMSGEKWALDGNIALTGSDDTTLSVASGALSLGGAVVSAGVTQVSSGATLNVTDTGSLTSSGVTIDSGATFTNTGIINSDITNSGVYSTFDVAAPKSVFSSHINGNFVNSGTLQLTGNRVGNVLTIAGDYQGNNGLVILNSELAGDSSPTDKLIIEGNSLGNSGLQVNNIGGLGAKTLQGLELIDVNGSSTGKFTLTQRAVAGAYEYGLLQNKTSGNWYLRSSKQHEIDPEPVPTPDPTPTPTPDPEPTPAVDPTPAPVPQVDPVTPTLYRPETGAYLGNETAAQGMFIPLFHDPSKEHEQGESQVWGFAHTDETKNRAAGGDLSLKTNSSVLMLGGDLVNIEMANGSRYEFGAMAGTGNSRTKSTADGNSYTATGIVTGYSLGTYANWYQDAKQHLGFYTNSRAQYSWYNNSVKGDDLAQENYRSQGIQASLETGYMLAFAQSGQREWTLEPQVQALYNHFDSENHTESNGSSITGGTDDSVLTRVGVRLSNRNATDLGAIVPYVEVNWENGRYADSLQFNGDTISSDVPNNRYGVRTGLNGNVSKNIKMWGDIGADTGEDRYQRYQAAVGLKVGF